MIDPDLRYRRDLATTLGFHEGDEPPSWPDLLAIIRESRRAREEQERAVWGKINDAISALEKNWDKLNMAQQWSARERLRDFAKSLPKIDPKDLPGSGPW